MVSRGDPQVAQYRDDFEALLEGALSAGESVQLMGSVADEMFGRTA